MNKTVGMLLMPVALAMVSIPSFAHTSVGKEKQKTKTEYRHLCKGIAPRNDLYISEFDKNAGGIDKATFDNIISKVEQYYVPIARAKGATLTFNRLWSESDIARDFDGNPIKDPMTGKPINGALVNAFAMQSKDNKKWGVWMFGGLARHKITSADGFALVVCHETGHHLGGFPRNKGPLGNALWSSNEGQSDYFATMKCFRRVMEKEDNAAANAAMSIPKLVADKCAVQHKSKEEIELCKRGAMGGMNLAQLLSDLGRDGAVGFDTPDTSEVSTTNNRHPEAQCRLDTYFAGAVCGVAYSEDFAADNAVGGACAEERGDKFAFRPHCWYKPSR